MKRFTLSLLLVFPLVFFAQTNVSLSDTNLLTILKVEHDPSLYQATNQIDQHDRIICELNDNVSADSLHYFLEKLASFETRHTWSDTVSTTKGIGAARRWVHSKFSDFSKRAESRLQPGYLVFDVLNSACGSLTGAKNVLAVLPGRDTSMKDIIVIEAHMDSRCDGRCDTACVAHGIDDNGSGTALVLELARVMSTYTFDRTILFMTTTGEEQGLLGADAMAQFAEDNNVQIRAVQNNDIVGGVICGITASPPGCSPPGSIDSLTLRIYANPVSYLFPHQSFARSVRMYYDEKLKPISKITMELHVMGQEDRTGRGGDHIPFRERGFRNLRFTSANEHGHGAPNANYTDRQHTSDDILGVDTDGDFKIDSFFVDFNYLARNTVVNATASTLLAQGPQIPEFIVHNETTGLRVEILNPTGAIEYRVGVRDGSQPDFDDLYSFSGTSFLVPDQTSGQFYFLSVSAIDSAGIMSPFSTEERAFSQSNTAQGAAATLKYAINCQAFGEVEIPIVNKYDGISFTGCRPNPFKHHAEFVIQANELPGDSKVVMMVGDQSGKTVAEIPVQLEIGENRVSFEYDGKPGILIATLKIGDRVMQSRKIMAR